MQQTTYQLISNYTTEMNSCLSVRYQSHTLICSLQTQGGLGREHLSNTLSLSLSVVNLVEDKALVRMSAHWSKDGM